MDAQTTVYHPQVRQFVLGLVARRWWLVGLTLVSIAVAAVLAFTTRPVYRAQVVLVRADTGDSAIALNSVLNQFGGIAAIAGAGTSSDQSVVEAIALLKSRQFTQDFIRDKNLMPRLFHDKWDAAAGKWKAKVKRPPTLWDAYKLFDRKIRHVDEDRKTGVVTLQVDWEDPQEAASWANDLVRRLNRQMKERALHEANTTIEYLTKELQRTDVASVQQAIHRLIETNLKQSAMANVREEYVFRVVDPAAPPDRKDRLKPWRTGYLIVGAFFGVLTGMLLVVSADALAQVRRWLSQG